MVWFHLPGTSQNKILETESRPVIARDWRKGTLGGVTEQGLVSLQKWQSTCPFVIQFYHHCTFISFFCWIFMTSCGRTRQSCVARRTMTLLSTCLLEKQNRFVSMSLGHTCSIPIILVPDPSPFEQGFWNQELRWRSSLCCFYLPRIHVPSFWHQHPDFLWWLIVPEFSPSLRFGRRWLHPLAQEWVCDLVWQIRASHPNGHCDWLRDGHRTARLMIHPLSPSWLF